MAFQMTCYTAATAQVSYSGDAIAGQAPVNKVGALLLTEGLAVMTATTIEIQGKGPNGPKQSQLQGKIFKTTQTGNTVKGNVYFDGGPGLSALDSTSCDEYVKMTDGTKVSGAISEVTASAITCARRSIPMNEVADVHSARVFKFTSSLGDKPHLTFEPTCIKVAATTKVKQTSSSDFPFGKVLLVSAVVAVVTCAIVLPITLTNSGRSHHNHKKNDRQINQFVYGKKQSSSTQSSQYSSCGP